MENKIYKLWVARDENGFLFAYEDKPTRWDMSRPTRACGLKHQLRAHSCM